MSATREDDSVPEPEFEAYWSSVDDELARIPARATTKRIESMCDDAATVFAVRLTSIGPARIFGYLSIPTGDGPFPGVLQVPRYGSVNNPPHPHDRARAIMLTLMHRGQRLANETYHAEYPGLLTDGITDPGTYLYRSIVADCLRGAEFLLTRPKLDPNRVATTGDDLALLTAARREGFASVRVNGQLFHRPWEAAEASSGYPVEELNDRLRAHPEERAAIARTLAYFDPVRHAPSVRATTLVCTDTHGYDDPEFLAPLVSAIAGSTQTYAFTRTDGVDNDFLDSWLAGRLGVPAVSKFLTPEDLAR